MSKIIHWILTKVPVFKQIDGYKTIIGGTLIVLFYGSQALTDLANMLPHTEILIQIQSWLAQLTHLLQRIVSIMGWDLMTIGLLHDKIKRSM